MIIIVVMLVMFIMVIRTDRKRQGKPGPTGHTRQTDLIFKLDFPGNFCRAAFAILAIFQIILEQELLVKKTRWEQEQKIHKKDTAINWNPTSLTLTWNYLIIQWRLRPSIGVEFPEFSKWGPHFSKLLKTPLHLICTFSKNLGARFIEFIYSLAAGLPWWRLFYW